MPEYRATSRAQAAAAASTLLKAGVEVCYVHVMGREQFRRSYYAKPKRPEYATQYYKSDADHAEIIVFQIIFTGGFDDDTHLLRQAWADLGWVDDGLHLKRSPYPNGTHFAVFALPLVRGRVRKKTVDPYNPGKRKIDIE